MAKRIVMLLLTMLGLTLIGCGPRWTVISQASPNPLIGKKDFIVMPIDYTGLKIGNKTEEEYLGAKEDKAEAKGKESSTRENLEGDKAEMNTLFLKLLQEDAQSEGIKVKTAAGEIDTYVIKPHIGFMEPGFYTYVVNKPSETIMRVKIEDKDGKLIDEIEIKHSSPATMTSPAAGNRYRSDAKAIGEIMADYLIKRTSPE